MKKKWSLIGLMFILSIVLAACGSGDDKKEAKEPTLSTSEMADKMVEEVEQPALIDLDADQLQDFHGIDAEKLEEYTARIPMMNVKTNELVILKVKDEADIPEIEEALKERAEQVAEQFATYLEDQAENAKNYKLQVNGKYVLFVISEDADKLLTVYDGFFK